MDMRDKIRENAELVVEQMQRLCDFDFAYDERSVEWLAGYIERQRVRKDIDEDTITGLVNVFGSYLGECIIQCYGGAWEPEENTWTVRFDERNAVFPFAKVSKQFANGREDSITAFFTLIPLIYEKILNNPNVPEQSNRKFLH